MSTTSTQSRWSLTNANDKRRPTEEDDGCPQCDHGWITVWVEKTIQVPWGGYDARAECPCRTAKTHRRFLDAEWPELTNAPVEALDGNLATLLESQSVHLIGSPAAVAPALRAALCHLQHRPSNPRRIRVYKDHRLPDLRYADVQARAFEDREVERLDVRADILVVRTGFAVGSNKSIGDTLANLIADRAEKTSKTLIIVSDPARPLDKSYKAVWSDDLGKALDRLPTLRMAA